MITFQADVMSTQVACNSRRAHKAGYALWFSKTKILKSGIAQLISQD